MEDLLEQLRHHTRPLHEALEKTEPATAVMSTDRARDGCNRLLAALHAAHSHIEPLIDAHLDSMTYRYMNKVPLLEADLRHLGIPFSLSSIPDSPLIHKEKNHQIGLAYVLEGSSMGNRVIRHHLQRCVGKSFVASLQFFNQDWERQRRNWSDLRDVMSRVTPTAHADVIQGATFAFEQFIRYFSAETVRKKDDRSAA